MKTPFIRHPELHRVTVKYLLNTCCVPGTMLGNNSTSHIYWASTARHVARASQGCNKCIYLLKTCCVPGEQNVRGTAVKAPLLGTYCVFGMVRRTS